MRDVEGALAGACDQPRKRLRRVVENLQRKPLERREPCDIRDPLAARQLDDLDGSAELPDAFEVVELLLLLVEGEQRDLMQRREADEPVVRGKLLALELRMRKTRSQVEQAHSGKLTRGWMRRRCAP